MSDVRVADVRVGDVRIDALGELRRAIDGVAAAGVVDLAELRGLMDRLGAVWLQHVRAAERAGGLARPRMNAAARLADDCRMPYEQALSEVKTARVLEALPQLAAAFANGSVPPTHVHVIARACTPERADAFAAVDEALTTIARDGTRRDVQRIVRNLTDALEDGAASDVTYERRRLHLSRSLHGIGFLDGQLDPEGTEISLTALEHRMNTDPDGPDEPQRTRAQRRADALVDIFRHYLRSHDAAAPASRRRGQPHISGVVSVELLAQHTGRATGGHNDLDFTGPIDASTWRRMACDCSIHRIVMRGPSEVLDVGRMTRTVPGPLWRALVARDVHCTRRGCTMPAAYCAAHHLVHWADGGPTKLANLVLLCWRHHREQHQRPAPELLRVPAVVLREVTHDSRAGP